MRHLLCGSLALLSTRRVTGRPYDNVFVCRGLVEYKAATHDRNTQVFPLYLETATDEDGGRLFSSQHDKSGHSNLAPKLYKEWSERLGVRSHEQMFYAIYAILFSQEYRRKYRQGLQQDYARVPPPASRAMCQRLRTLGGELTALHLLESPKLDQASHRVHRRPESRGREDLVVEEHRLARQGRRPPASRACARTCGTSTSAATRSARSGSRTARAARSRRTTSPTTRRSSSPSPRPSA